MQTPLITKIQQSIIGEENEIQTVFGIKPLIYADYTASGRSLSFIEDCIRTQVLPYYANTHSETAYTGAFTNQLREQARAIIHQAVNGDEDDLVIFCGSGATAAINKLIDILNIRLPVDLATRYRLHDHIPAEQRPVVFIGPYEHHSNELPWRESIADVVTIPLDKNGAIDLTVLQQKLTAYQNRPLLIGSFSAASNVTGIKSPLDKISQLLHVHGALSFCDYAAAAPYMAIDMNPTVNGAGKDAVFISTHKFVGGPGTPGLLIVKKSILNNTVPSTTGGGTVAFVSPKKHHYLNDKIRREEAGTPAIIESIRAGLVFKLQQQVGCVVIEKKEKSFIKRAFTRWQKIDNIEILGNTNADRLAIVSLRLKHQHKDLHYGFVVALLNDLFGIQARGGCSCAGPYGHHLLGIDEARSKALEEQVLAGLTVLRPGWVRLNFNYFIKDESFYYLVEAIELIAQHGWRLLPYYHVDKNTGAWRYQNQTPVIPCNLSNLDFLAPLAPSHSAQPVKPLSEYRAQALRELLRVNRVGQRYQLSLNSEAEKLRWFVLPQEIELNHVEPC